jgi:FkbM family methyltransferase
MIPGQQVEATIALPVSVPATLIRCPWVVMRGAFAGRLLGPERVVMRDQMEALGRSPALGLAGRARVRTLLLRELVLGPPRRAQIAVGHAHVELGGGRDFPIDWKAFVEIFADESYAAPYRDATVLDVGAHKGYFGAYALACGASVVVSFEPAATNYDVLDRAAKPLGDRWLTWNAAIGSTAGARVLILDRMSWAHSLLEVERPAGQQPVSIVTLEQALAELPEGGSRTIVKIDAEGSECDILARPGPLERVDVLMVEWHPALAPCTTEELTGNVGSSGSDSSPTPKA